MLGEPDKTEVRSVEPATTGAMCQGAEDALRASEPLYHSLVEALPQSLCRKDLEGRFTFANSRFCDSLNKTLDEIIGRTDLDIHPPDLAEKYRRDDRWVIETGQNLEVIEEHLPLGGQSAWVQVLKTPVRDADGTIMGVQIIFWDVTDRVQAEDELARYRVRLEDLVEERTVKLGQANERLRHEIARRQQVQEALTRERDLLYALMDNIPDTIYFKDTASRFTRINKAQARLLGAQDPEAAVGKTDQDFFASEHAQAAYADEQAIVASGQPLIDKIERLRGADGQWRWVSATKAPIVGQDGRVVGLVGISRDVTERQQIEEERRRLIQGLQDALAQVRTLSGLIPICSSCKKIRDDQGYWNHLEQYIREHSEAEFTHGICPDCARRLYPGMFPSTSTP